MASESPLLPVEFTLTLRGAPDIPWRVARFEHHEALSRPHRLVLEAITDAAELDLDALLGASVELVLGRPPRRRSIAGIVRAWSFLAHGDAGLGLRLEVVPALALLDQGSDSRIWQDKSVPEIVAEVIDAPLRDHGRAHRFDLDLAAYPPREQCIQYRESDLAFIDRLLAEEGIFYRFEVEDGVEVLVFTDSVSLCPPADDDALPFVTRATASRAGEAIEALAWRRALTCTAVHQRVWSWRRAGEAANDDERSGGGPARRALYEHAAAGETIPAHRPGRALERESAPAAIALGRSDAIALGAGRHLGVLGAPGGDTDLLITELTLRGEAPDAQLHPGDPTPPRLVVDFEALPAGVPYRPPLRPAPAIGTQSARVVGPEGEEIHTDEDGRVQVRFHWDRREPADAPSCWLRVAQGSAGPGFGSLFLPRVGAEVLVEFIDGSPDRPVVTGALYNSHNRPPCRLPQAKTRSVLRSESTPGGGGFNEIAFEDARGAEVLALRAQRDLHEAVGQDLRRSVGRDSTVTVTGHAAEAIGGDHEVVIGGSQASVIETGEHSLVVCEGSSSVTVESDINVESRSGHARLAVPNGALVVQARAAVEIAATAGDASITADGAFSAHSTRGIAFLGGEPGVEITSARGPIAIDAAEDLGVRSARGALTLEADGPALLESRQGEVLIRTPTQAIIESLSDIRLEAPAIELVASESITLSVGPSKISITPKGIEISGPTISSAAVGPHTLTGALIKIN